MPSKIVKTFKEWLGVAEDKKQALLLESKEKQNEKVKYPVVISLTAHLMSPEIKNRPTGMIWDRLRAYLYNRVNHKQGFTQLELLKIKSSDKFPKALASDFAKSYEKWQAENLG
jgi:hypothetical protein